MTDASTTGAVDAPLDKTLVAHNKALIDRNATLVAERDAAIQRAEAAEQERDDALEGERGYRRKNDALHRSLTEARAQAALAWEAGRDAAGLLLEERDHYGLADDVYSEITPPADLTAALTARLDAEWNDAIEAAGNLESIHGYSNAVPRHRIRALRRAAPTEEQR